MVEEAYVIGDLHLGAGRGDPLEDFDQDDALAAFVDSIAGEGRLLVVNGDLIDFVQIAPFEVPAAAHLLWNEEASVQKLEVAVKAHRAVFNAFGRFVEAGGRLAIVIGNHDLDFWWGEVQRHTREAISRAHGERVEFHNGSLDYHGVVIEHGHRFTPENCPRDFLRFVHIEGEVAYLERVWGTDFMLQFYNDLERRYPFADNVKPMLRVVWHGLRKGWIGGREIVRLLLFLKKRGVPWAGLSSSLLDGPPVDPGVVMGAFADPEWQRLLCERASDLRFQRELREALAALPAREQQVVGTAEQVTLGFVGEQKTEATLGLVRDDRELRAAREVLKRAGVSHAVFGHTHEVIDGKLDGCLFNPGTWLPCLDLASPKVQDKVKAAGGLSLEMLDDASLYVIERRAVRVVAEGASPARVELLTV